MSCKGCKSSGEHGFTARALGESSSTRTSSGSGSDIAGSCWLSFAAAQTAERPLSLNAKHELKIPTVPARFLYVQITDQVTFGAVVKIYVNDRLAGRIGDVAPEDLTGKIFGPFDLRGAALTAVKIESSGELSALVSAHGS
jgi:hypothetical protein